MFTSITLLLNLITYVGDTQSLKNFKWNESVHFITPNWHDSSVKE